MLGFSSEMEIDIKDEESNLAINETLNLDWGLVDEIFGSFLKYRVYLFCGSGDAALSMIAT